MTQIERDETREERIMMEIIVDAYGPEEQIMGWYYYLDDTMRFPFKAQCIAEQRASPLREKEHVEVLGMIPYDNYTTEMLVEIRWQDRTLGVPLAQLEGVDVDEETQQAIEDWHYWKARGYTFY